MAIPVWTRQRTRWHDSRRGWFSIPPGTRGHRVWLDDLSSLERAIFAKILKRSTGYVLIHLAQQVRAVHKALILEKTSVIDATDLERAAMAAALPPLGEYVGSIGMHRPLAAYTKQEVLTLIDVVVTAYQDYFIKHNDDIPF